MPLKILVLSFEGDGSDLAFRLSREKGNSVRLFIKDKDCKENLNGLVEKTENWVADLSWCDFVVLDDNGFEKDYKFLSNSKKPIFGMPASRELITIGKKSFPAYESGFVLENNREVSQNLMRDLGIGDEFESLQFKNVNDILKHLKEHEVRHVIKPESANTQDKATTFVGEIEDNSDSIGWLETLHLRPGGNKIKSFELQERKQGVEAAIQGWFSGDFFLESVNINFEHKKLASGDIGFMTGEQGNAMYNESRPNDSVKLFNLTLKKMAPFLRRIDYRGSIDINFIINKEGLYPLEFTPRLGYPPSYIQQNIQNQPWGGFLYDIARGIKTTNNINSGWAMGVILVGEGYPFWNEAKKRMNNLPILGIGNHNIDNIHFCDSKFEDNKFITTGALPLIATGIKPSLEGVQDFVYHEVIPSIYFPGIYFRNDIGDRVFEDVKKLNQMGYDIMPTSSNKVLARNGQ